MIETTSISQRLNYDVYVSFRDGDIPTYFIDHLFSNFRQNGVRIFRHDNELHKGEISPELYKIIGESRFLLVILSKNYASSSWWLRELVKTLECNQVKGHKHEIRIIFYDAKLDVARKQMESHTEAFAEHNVLHTTQVAIWKKSLSMAANLSGWDVNDMAKRYESKFIAVISNEILKRLYQGSFHASVSIYESHQAEELEDDEYNSFRRHDKFYIDFGDGWKLCIHDNVSKAEIADFKASRKSGSSNNFLCGIKDDADLKELYPNLSVFRAWDPHDLESVYMINKLQISAFAGKMLALPAPDDERSSLSAPVHDIKAQNVTFKRRRSRNSLKHKKAPTLLVSHQENLPSLYAWFLEFLVATLSFFIALTFHFWSFVRRKAIEVVQDIMVQYMSSKKKKARKFRNSRLDANTKNIGNRIRYAETSKCNNLLIPERKIGRLFVSSKEMRHGSNGTIVLEGTYDSRPVAVKRILKVHHNVVSKEIQNLKVSDQHPNIVRFYGVERDQDFAYIALERCICSLHDLIMLHSNSIFHSQPRMKALQGFKLRNPNGYPSPELLKVMRDIVSGLAYLHEHNIIHGDLNPENVQICKDGTISAKVSDIGISKCLPAGYGCLSGRQTTKHRPNKTNAHAVDLFSFGQLLFFCITGGRHSFGDMLELSLVDNIPEAFHLVSCLLNHDPKLRPKAVKVPHHPLFWDPDMRLSFLRDASDRVELKGRKAHSNLVEALENVGTIVLCGKWVEKLDDTIVNNIDNGYYRKYKYHRVCDLLRLIRNLLNHYRQLPKEVQVVLGTVPTGFESYFRSRWPKLLMEVYKVLQEHCEEDELFHKYYKARSVLT